MLKTLKTLIRVQDSTLKITQQKLAEALAGEEKMRHYLKLHEQKMQAETEFVQNNNSYNHLASQSYGEYMIHATATQKNLQSLLRDAEGVTQIARNNLLTAYRESKKLKKIETRKKAEWQTELNAKEQKGIDDLVQSLQARKN